MSQYAIHTIDSAPEKSKPVLKQLHQTFAIIPNIAGVMAESPVLISGFIGLFQQVHAGSFTERQIQTLLLTNAVTNACSWAAAFHTMLALKEGLDPDDVQAIRENRLPKDSNLAALSLLTKTLIATRGHISNGEIAQFLDAGFIKGQVLEVLAVLAASTITNYSGNVAQPVLEEAFQEHAWAA